MDAGKRQNAVTIRFHIVKQKERRAHRSRCTSHGALSITCCQEHLNGKVHVHSLVHSINRYPGWPSQQYLYPVIDALRSK